MIFGPAGYTNGKVGEKCMEEVKDYQQLPGNGFFLSYIFCLWTIAELFVQPYCTIEFVAVLQVLQNVSLPP